MKKVVFLILLFVFSTSYSYAGFFSNSSTDITSFKDSSYAEYKISKIMICCMGLDLDSRAKAENCFVKEFTNKKISLIPVSSLKYILPTRQYTNEEINQLLKQNSIDSVLIMNILDQYENKSYVPETSTTVGSGYATGNNVNMYSNTYKSGGYYISKPRIKVELKIYETTTEKNVWIANTFTRGNGYANFKSLISSLAEKSFKQLLKDELLTKVDK